MRAVIITSIHCSEIHLSQVNLELPWYESEYEGSNSYFNTLFRNQTESEVNLELQRCESGYEGSNSYLNALFRNQTRNEVKLEPALPLLAEPAWEEVQTSQQELCLPFTSPACSSSALVGGKGSQLALLTQMSEKVLYSVLLVVLSNVAVFWNF